MSMPPQPHVPADGDADRDADDGAPRDEPQQPIPATAHPQEFVAIWHEEFDRLAALRETFAHSAAEMAREMASDVAAAVAAAALDPALDLTLDAEAAREDPLAAGYAEMCFGAQWERVLMLWTAQQMGRWRRAYNDALTREHVRAIAAAVRAPQMPPQPDPAPAAAARPVHPAPAADRAAVR